jgi:hypothetical protein
MVRRQPTCAIWSLKSTEVMTIRLKNLIAQQCRDVSPFCLNIMMSAIGGYC